MRLKIEILMDNAAFTPTVGPEVARLLRMVADSAAYYGADDDDLARAFQGWILRDANGNPCGLVRVLD